TQHGWHKPAPNLVALQAEALGQVTPRLHHSLVRVVGGAEHAAGLLQTVKGQLRGSRPGRERGSMRKDAKSSSLSNSPLHAAIVELSTGSRSVERRVAKECRSRWSPYHSY